MNPLARRSAVLLLALLAGHALAQDKAAPNRQPPSTQDRPARKFGLEKPRERAPGAVRLATYNIENLFDDKDDPALSGEHEDATMTKPAADCAAAAAAIRAIDADVLALQEVESLDAVKWFRDTHLQGMGYEHVVSLDAGDERGIEQAVLSRYPVVETVQWVGLGLGGIHPEKWGNQPNHNAGKPITYHRSPLAVTIEVPGSPASAAHADAGAKPYRFTLVVVHHKAGRDGEYWREKEAAKTVEVLAEMQRTDPERNIVWVGDFNATLSDPSMKLVTAAGWYDVMAEPQAEPIRKAGPNGRPWNDAAIITHASGRIIDRILLNPAARREYVPASAFVLGTSMRGNDGYASDHYPLVIELTPRDLPAMTNP